MPNVGIIIFFSLSLFFQDVLWLSLSICCKDGFGTAMGLEDTWQNVILLGEMSIEYLPNRGAF